ncbi:MAG TPA: hypothetical protein VMV31_00045 [Terriglobales bacterium]|nr:hypothetical protein [Terriglobales bacterium]
MANGVVYCNQCGKAVGAAPAAAAYAPPAAGLGRVAQHRNILGVLWLVLGGLGLIGAFVLLSISSFRPWENPWSPPTATPDFLVPLLSGIGTVLLVFSLLRVVAGVGILQTQPWARMLTIVLGVVSLIEIPLGTALGIYTLWVLIPANSEAEFQRLAAARRS